MNAIRWGLAAAIVWVPCAALAETYHVAPDGSDDAAGTAGAPWQSLQHAADSVSAGDVVMVAPGTYAGFHLTTSGTEAAPIHFRGAPDAASMPVVDRDNARTPDGINLEGVSDVIVEGFEIVGATRAGIRAADCERVTIRGNRADANGRWGIFTAFCDDLLIENNECSRSADEHGIYTSNSGDRPVIRGNLLWGNSAAGIHMNGDVNFGGDGIITGALVEGNTIHGNGTIGGSAINCDGVQDSVIRNNLLYGNFATGIALFRIDGGGGSTGNRVVNNTIVMPGDNRWAIRIRDGSGGTTIRNNILWNGHAARGAIDVTTDSLDGFSSDNNAVISRFTLDDATTILDIDQWRAETGNDLASLVASPEELFVDPVADDYRLRQDSPAIDSGTIADAPDHDLAGNRRPTGAGVDIGALEYCADDDCAAPPTPGTGAGADDDLAGGCGCTGAAGVAGWGPVLACLLAVRRRRRRT